MRRSAEPNGSSAAGDMTGYGPFPDDVCHFLEKRQIPAIIGNYDRKVLDSGETGQVGREGDEIEEAQDPPLDR